MRFATIRAAGASGTPAKAPPAAKVKRSVLRLLRENVLFSMATVTVEGRAHVNTVYFAWSEDLDLFFLSHPGSLHCRNLARNPSMSAAVFSSEQTWGHSDRGVQLFGTCARATGALAGKAERLYGRHFRGFPRWWAGLAADDAAREYRFYRFAVRSLKVIDDRAFGGAVFVSAVVVRKLTAPMKHREVAGPGR